VVSGPGRAPVLEHVNQATLCNVVRHDIGGHIRNTEAGAGRGDHLRDPAENELSVHPDLNLAPALFEFPRIKSAIGREPQIDATVRSQILRFQWGRMPGEIRFRTDGCEGSVWADTQPDHVFADLLAPAHARVVAFGHDIRKSVIGDELDLDVRVLPQQRRQLRPKNGFNRVLASGYPDGACGLLA
jgi:hypothetical protein